MISAANSIEGAASNTNDDGASLSPEDVVLEAKAGGGSRAAEEVADEGEEEELEVDDGGGGSMRLAASSSKLALGATGAIVGAAPLAVLMGIESLRGRTGTRQWVWNKVGGAIKDVAGVAAVAAPGAYGRVRWSWEPELFGGKNVVGLTIDDAPGDNPELFEQVLDILKEFGARATFMCMTDSIVGPMVALIQRAVEEGHELANHCPADRSYSMHFKAGFKRALHQSEEALRPYKRKQMETPSAAYLQRVDVQRKRKQMKWFRPPMGHMSSTMGSVLKEEKYSVALGDCFSNDVLVGEKTRVSNQAGKDSAIKFHVDFCVRTVKAGSIMIFHVPRKDDRVLAPDYLRAVFAALRTKDPQVEFRCLSEMACLAEEGRAMGKAGGVAEATEAA